MRHLNENSKAKREGGLILTNANDASCRACLQQNVKKD